MHRNLVLFVTFEGAFFPRRPWEMFLAMRIIYIEIAIKVLKTQHSKTSNERV